MEQKHSLKVGRLVWWDGGAEVGRIVEVCHSDFEKYGVLGPGIFICRLLDGDCSPIFYDDEFLEDDGIEILTDEELRRLHEAMDDVNHRTRGIFPKTISLVINDAKATVWRIRTFSEELVPVESFDYEYGNQDDPMAPED